MFGHRKKHDVDSYSITGVLRPVEVPEEQQPVIRARQLQTVGRLTPIVGLANVINAAVVVMSFWNTPAARLLGIWSVTLLAATAVMLGANIASRNKHKKRDPRTPPSVIGTQKGIERYARFSSLLGMIWGVLPLLVMPFTDYNSQMTVSIIMAGMMFGGVILISRIPEAALSFLIPITIGYIVGLQLWQDPRNDYLSVLALVYAGVLWVTTKWSHRQFIEQHLSGLAIQQQAQLIGLLLRDFEESTSDWLWQTDANGTLVDIPMPTLGEKGSSFQAMAKGGDIGSLFLPTDTKNTLMRCLERKQGFRDLVLNVDNEDGAWWSLTGKPIYDTVGRFIGFRGVASDITQSKAIEDRIAYMAHYDPLTGLPNRACLHEQLEKIALTPVEEGNERALLWLDLDNFKWVNDTLGHPAGDELLCQVASRLNEHIGSAEIIARLGGDEFAILVEMHGRDALLDCIQNLSDRLNEPYEIWGSIVHCGASIGVRIVEQHSMDIDTLLKHADLALYQAKESGKRTWCVFTPELAEKAKARRGIELDLHRALENEELTLYFQPQMCAHTGRIVGCETLIRWNHPSRGLIGPNNFIQHAEDSGIITRLGDWALREALFAARRLPDDMGISVNISPLQIHSSSLVTTIVNALAVNQIDPSRLELEITESVLMSDTEFTLDRLNQLKDIGVRIALDDFGTGFSSLNYLRRFPFDKLKIDKSFVEDIDHNDDSRAITQATLELARALNMTCTAEGVETESQKQFLTEIGCDELQGFMISRPQPLEKLSHLFPVLTQQEADEALATKRASGDADTSVIQLQDAANRRHRRMG
ncbi:putative bifunctional diguanylate cyclase/phosphodiesterase [Henriciella aquimarina]|uniref:putative bifunctional diguanylate cyclase/phosphodiesterase n=1 Tax=Henriciella aquimarina TaxID=545261 RepID=UPI000A003A88|nr:GGDEF and EAL domain-containing protein [Henriciella aquimarina]